MEQTFFTQNRQALLDQLKKGALVVMTGYGEMQASNDKAHTFEQEANFWYLTGIELADWWLILDGANGTQWLVSPEMSEIQEIFDGGINQDEVYRISGIKTIITRDEALRRLRQLAKQHSVVYTTEQPEELKKHSNFQFNNSQAEMKKILDRIFQNVQICNRELAIQRTIKRPEEVNALQQAIDITISGFEFMKAVLPKAKYEYELEAALTYEIRRKGAKGHAYDPIVASGSNACTMHYDENSNRMHKRDLILFDVGAKVYAYAADIARTYSISKPTKRQQAVHDAVYQAEIECMNLMKPGMSFSEYGTETDQIMKNALSSLNLSTERYREYFPHAIGHGLGINEHDSLTGYKEMQPGMVITVEPGIYIREEGIGVRLEDDILITEKGHRNLSAALSTNIR